MTNITLNPETPEWARVRNAYLRRGDLPACYCMGPKNGDPYCACVMEAKGWEMRKPS